MEASFGVEANGTLGDSTGDCGSNGGVSGGGSTLRADVGVGVVGRPGSGALEGEIGVGGEGGRGTAWLRIVATP